MLPALSGNVEKPVKQSENDLPEAMGQFSVATDDSDKTLKPPKNLSDMPFDAVGLIIERSDYKEQLILRKTSKSLRALVDKQQPSCSRLYMWCSFNFIICNYNDHCVAYVSPNWDREHFLSKYQNWRLDKIISKTDYEKVAFDDLASTLKNPKLQLEVFSFNSEDFDDYYEMRDFYEELYNKFIFGDEDDRNWKNRLENMQKTLKSLNHKVSVKECRIDVYSPGNATSILPYLKPGVLEKIKMFSVHDNDEWREWYETMKQVALLDQWKQAKELHVECGLNDEFPKEHATHFKGLPSNGSLFYHRTLVLIRDCMLKHENIEFCSIPASQLVKELFDRIAGTPVSPGLSHYTVSNSKYYLEFKIENKLVTIEKKNK